MPRSLPEWIGTTADTPVPPRVRLRVKERDRDRCQCGCNRQIFHSDKWNTDHTKALINDGENRENNLRTLLDGHEKQKNAADVAEKSFYYQRRLKRAGLKRPSRPFPGSKADPLHRKKKINGIVLDRRTGEPWRMGR